MDKTNKMSIDPGTAVKIGVAIARFLRWAKAKGVVGSFRRRASLEFARTWHSEILVPLNDASVAIAEGPLNKRVVIEKLSQFCTGCRFLLCQLVEVDPNQMHCCIKVLTRPQAQSRACVETFTRSLPTDGRGTVEETSYYVDENTVWSALIGGSDGQQTWRRFNCFSCNDLAKEGEEFRCSRPEWRRYYNSAIVFPLYYPDPHEPHKFEIFGFLAWDSPQQGCFKEMPNIFEYKSQWNVYHDMLPMSAVYNFGAAAATALSVALRPAYQVRQSKGQIDAGSQEKRNLLE